MKLIEHLSIRAKLIVIQVITSILVVTLGVGLFTYIGLASLKKFKLQNTEFAAKVVAENSIPTILFMDEVAAYNILIDLGVYPDVVNASLITRDGKLFANYFKKDHSDFKFTFIPEKSLSYYIGNKELFVFQGIVNNGEKIGTLCLRSDMGRLREIMNNMIFSGFAIIFIAAVVAYFVGNLMQRQISGPVLKLKNLTDEVRKTCNYGIRAESEGSDEIAVLSNAFNEMLEQIQARDNTLYEAKNTLEETVNKRTRELNNAISKLQISNNELEQFAYVASHDLQEPLRTIKSYVQLMERKYKAKFDSDANEYMNFIVGGAERMYTLINDLLTYSRIGTKAKPFAPVNLNNVIDLVQVNLKEVVNESKAEIILDNPLPQLMADETQLIQLFQNLIANSIKYQAKGNIPIIHIGSREVTGEEQFYVKDNGIGISKEHFDRIFIIFQRLHSREEYSGTGIGLAVCKKIVERHHGKIWVESEGKGKGSTFYFTIKT